MPISEKRLMIVMKDSVKKGFKLIFVDFSGLIVGILNGFLLPMVFRIEGYALFKTFSLYATYATVFSFGLSDGLYLFYGGKRMKEIDTSKTKAYYLFLMKLQGVVLVVLFLVSFFLLKDMAFLFFSLFVFPLQLIHFFRLYYKALGEFDRYSVLQGVLVTFELLNTLFIVFLMKSQEPHLFISIKIANHLLVASILTFVLVKQLKGVRAPRLKWSQFKEIIKPGFVVLMADTIAMVIFSLDRFFVKGSFNDEAFAYYSFAVSILNLFLVFILSITSIFYSYLSRKVGDRHYIINLKHKVLLLSFLFPSGYFLLEYIVTSFIGNYVQSLEVLWILMLTLPFLSVINVVYINMYKASKSIGMYLKRMLVVLCSSLMLNVLALVLFDSTIAIAWSSLLSFAFWYVYSSKDLEGARITWGEVLYILLLMGSFVLVKASDLGVIWSMGLYTVVVCVVSFIVIRPKSLRRLL